MKKLSFKNKTRLKQYTAVAGAIVAHGNMNAQVVVTDVNPDVIVDSLSGPYSLDFNNDANPEMNFLVQHISGSSSTSGIQFTYEGAVATVNLSPGMNLIVTPGMGSSSSSSQLTPLNNGDLISSAANFGSSSTAYLLGLDAIVDAGILGQIPVQQGNFLNQSHKYLGGKLTAGANSFYGWVELSVSSNASQITIHKYAYQSTPNTSILAGEGGNAGLEQVALENKVTIIGTPENVKINVTPDLIGAAVSIVSMSGQSLKSDVLTDVNNTISFDGISTGIYQVVVSTSTEKTTERVYIK